MKTFARYWRLFVVQMRTSVSTGMTYRLDFFVQGIISIFWFGTTLVPLFVVFRDRPTIAGWTRDTALVVAGWFVLMKGLLEGAITPSLMAVVEHVRKGTLDFVLLKPADAQFLVSTTRIQPFSVIDMLGGVVIMIVALVHVGRMPSASDFFAAIGLLLAATAVLYSIWILVISLAFYVVRIDNLSYLFMSVFDAARYPISAYRGPVRVIFTFILPLAVMTTFPAMAVLGTLTPGTAAASLAGAAAFSVVARQIWRVSIRRYTSASS
jgi:ABC-2 type transport system permease protein